MRNVNKTVFCLVLTLIVFVGVCSNVHGQSGGLLPLDTGWEYPQYLTFRPGNGQECDVNPPRFSWPYVPHVLPRNRRIRLHDFRLQISRNGDFARPDIEVATPYNFYNALPVLDSGLWHWRVGYWVGKEEEQWSAVRAFKVTAESVPWDRTVIEKAVQKLSGLPHPRISPADGDWEQWRKSLMEDERTARWLEATLTQAKAVTAEPWWRDFPRSDRPGQAGYKDVAFTDIARKIALTAFAYRLTEDRRFATSRTLAVKLASFPKGGLSSPEYHGGPNKRATQVTEFIALAYDWWYPDLSKEERRVLLDSIEWRLHATYLEEASWVAGRNINYRGVAVLSGSHAYENFMWSLPAVLLTAGDLPLSDELVPLCLNYLTGVTSAHGPEEGWNEGLSYGCGKGHTMLKATMAAALLLPELNLGQSPFYDRLGEWYGHLAPLGIQRVPFGNYGNDPDNKRGIRQHIFRHLAWLTGNGQFSCWADVLAAEVGNAVSLRPWIDLLVATTFPWPEARDSKDTQIVFPEAGWVMVSSAPPMDRAAFQNAAGMLFKCRPRGGYSHSFRSETGYVWHAHGATLTAGGGSTVFRDPHAHGSISHNVILINGEGQEWDYKDPAYPFTGRLLAYLEGEGYTHWVGDATHAYQTVPGLLRCHRHVVFVDNTWFVVFDDIAMRPDAEPAQFSWLYHVAPEVPLHINEESTEFNYTMDGVHAAVHLAYPDVPVELIDVQGRDTFVNRITGEDLYDAAAAGVAKKGTRTLREEHWMAHSLWLTNKEPTRDWSVMAVLTARPEEEPPPKVELLGERAVRVTSPDGAARTVSFDPGTQANVMVDLDAVRAHALATDPGMLPLSGPEETLEIDGDKYTVQWLAQERFDGDDWVSRWIFEGNSEASVRDGKLWVRRTKQGSPNTATIWFRPELPRNVLVRFRAEAVGAAESNAANKNLFLHARESDGSRLRFGRSGSYKEYHEFPNYLVTFTGGFRKGWSRARRDPGFNLLHESSIRSEVDQEYAVTVTFQDGRLRYYIDGKKIHDVTDPDPLPGGRFGVRSWSTIGWWDDIEIGRIIGRN